MPHAGQFRDDEGWRLITATSKTVLTGRVWRLEVVKGPLAKIKHETNRNTDTSNNLPSELNVFFEVHFETVGLAAS